MYIYIYIHIYMHIRVTKAATTTKSEHGFAFTRRKDSRTSVRCRKINGARVAELLEQVKRVIGTSSWLCPRAP